jgi:hypothetical protein
MMQTQKQLYYAAEQKAANRNAAMLDLLYGLNPITDKELRSLIEKRPNIYGKYSGYLGKRPGLEE